MPLLFFTLQVACKVDLLYMAEDAPPASAACGQHVLLGLASSSAVPKCLFPVQVAREVFNVCMAKTLRDKTRILVTNQLQFVNSADLIVHMSNGRIQERGTYEELLAKQGAFAQMMSGSEVCTG